MENKIDLFTPIHKAIRSLIYHTGVVLQSTDFSNLEEGDRILTQLEQMLILLEDHARHEDHIIFPEIEKRASGISGELEAQHREGEIKLTALVQLLNEFRELVPQSRVNLVTKLSIIFSDFIAFYIWHMSREEEIIMPVSKANFSNAELAEIRLKIQEQISPDRYREWMKWMLPALNESELTSMYRQAKHNGPGNVFELINSIGQEFVDPVKWDRISSSV